MTTADQLLLGSGYRPHDWCRDPECMALVPAGAVLCPRCDRLHNTTAVRRTLALFDSFTALTPRQMSVATDGNIVRVYQVLLVLEEMNLVAFYGSRFQRTSLDAVLDGVS